MAGSGALVGRGVAFPVYVNANGSMAWSVGPDNVRQSIQLILMTDPGERLMLPEFGAGLRGFLFQPNTAATRKLIQQRVITALSTWEKRIQVESVVVDADPNDPSAAVVTVNYEIPAVQVQEQVHLRVQLNGG